jgi:hypothetical protein
MKNECEQTCVNLLGAPQPQEIFFPLFSPPSFRVILCFLHYLLRFGDLRVQQRDIGKSLCRFIILVSTKD